MSKNASGSTNAEENLSNATLVNLSSGNSTAIEETSEVLLVYAYNHTP